MLIFKLAMCHQHFSQLAPTYFSSYFLPLTVIRCVVVYMLLWNFFRRIANKSLPSSLPVSTLKRQTYSLLAETESERACSLSSTTEQWKNQIEQRKKPESVCKWEGKVYDWKFAFIFTSCLSCHSSPQFVCVRVNRMFVYVSTNTG